MSDDVRLAEDFLRALSGVRSAEFEKETAERETERYEPGMCAPHLSTAAERRLHQARYDLDAALKGLTRSIRACAQSRAEEPE